MMHSTLNLLLVAVALVHQSTCEIHDRSLLDEIPMINLDSDHLAKGSQAPGPFPPGTVVRAYVTCFSPYSERVLIALALKEIPCEVVNINLSDKPEWFTDLTPLGKVPLIEHEGKLIYESLVIAEYLDSVFKTGTKLMPDSPLEKAKQFMLLEELNSLHMDQKSEEGWIRNRNDQKKIDGVYSAMAGYEALLKDRPFLAGANASFVDYMNWPFVQQIFTIEILSEGRVKLTAEKYPKFSAYIERMKNIPMLKAILFTVERHAQFIESVVNGKPDYDAHVAPVTKKN